MSGKQHGKQVAATWVKIEKEKDRLRMGGGSWSVNLDEMPKEIDTIEYITEKATYSISVTEAAIAGFERTLGGERKLVVPVKHWRVVPK